MNIAMDIDGVLASFTEAFKTLARARYGRPAPDYFPQDWWWSDALTREEIDVLWGDVALIENFWETIPVMDVDSRLMRAVYDRHNLLFPTARAFAPGKPVALQTAEWLHAKFGIRYPMVFVSNEKGPLAKALKYDYFIDDKVENVEAVQLHAGDRCKVFIKSMPYNREFKQEGVKRVADANEFLRIVLSQG